MTKGGNDITKKEWDAYVSVQKSGLYNMYSPEAIRETGLKEETYVLIMKNYSELKEKFNEKEED